MVKAPPGFISSCARYAWLCTERPAAAARLGDSELIELARRINATVNESVAPLTDPENYGVAEYWTLPENGRGDCEDYALEKYRQLLEAGIASADLRVAIVLDGKRNNHVVLVLRHPSGDLVLDNLNRDVMPWNRTGYSFLAIQHGAASDVWEVVADRSPQESRLASR